MNTIKTIRERLGVTQAVLAQAVGRTQGNVAFYERGQSVPSDVAKRLIVFASERGVVLSYEDIYGPALANSAQAATETVVQGV
ncbi:MAG: helix-turn-helix domain-containing protein [Rhodoferax sp.]|nr:MAG: helix-turn-helix domain-containing protein [Rhodoferax sp.]